MMKLNIDNLLLKKIKPQIKGESDKYSWNLWKWLNKYKTEKLRVYYLPNHEDDKYDPTDFDNVQILIGERWRDNCIVGMTLRTIIATDRGLQSGAFTTGCGYNVHVAQDVTEQFFEDYIEFGRCFLFEHGAWLRNGDKQFTYQDDGNERWCNWCGRVERKRIEVETKIIERVIWE